MDGRDNLPKVAGSSSPLSPELFLLRARRVDFVVVYSSLIVLAILLLLIVFFGSGTTWYRNLSQPNINPWFVRALWIMGTIFSYMSFFFIWQDVRVYEIPIDLIVSTLFIVSSFLFVAWGVVYYYAEDIVWSWWVVLLILTYNLWLFVYVLNINTFAALFLVPNILLYIYLLYATMHMASINDIPM